MASVAGHSLLIRRPRYLPYWNVPWLSTARITERVARKPVITKNMVTPMKPPSSSDGRVWNATTPSIATARRPSMPSKRICRWLSGSPFCSCSLMWPSLLHRGFHGYSCDLNSRSRSLVFLRLCLPVFICVHPAKVPFARRRMGLSRERRGDDSPPTVIRLSPVPHHAIFDGFGAGVAKGDSGPIHRSLENGGFRDPCFATPRDVKAHIAWCGSLLCHTMRFWGVFRLVWHTGWERISRTDG